MDNKSVKIATVHNKTTRSMKRADVVLWSYNEMGEVKRDVVYEDMSQGMAEIAKRAIEKALVLLDYEVFK